MYVVQEVVHVPSTFAIRIYDFPIAAVGRSRARSRILIEVKSCSWIHEILLPVCTGCAASSCTSSSSCWPNRRRRRQVPWCWWLTGWPVSRVGVQISLVESAVRVTRSNCTVRTIFVK